MNKSILTRTDAATHSRALKRARALGMTLMAWSRKVFETATDAEYQVTERPDGTWAVVTPWGYVGSYATKCDAARAAGRNGK